MSSSAPAGISDDRGEGGTEAQVRIRFGDPDPPSVAGQPSPEKIDRQRQGRGRSKGERGCGRLVHAGHLLVVTSQHSYRYQNGAPLPLMNNPG